MIEGAGTFRLSAEPGMGGLLKHFKTRGGVRSMSIDASIALARRSQT